MLSTVRVSVYPLPQKSAFAKERVLSIPCLCKGVTIMSLLPTVYHSTVSSCSRIRPRVAFCCVSLVPRVPSRVAGCGGDGHLASESGGM